KRLLENFYIYGNIFWQEHNTSNYTGMGLVACINGQICSHWYIYNNTAVGFQGDQVNNGVSWGDSDPSSTDINVYNNLWYGTNKISFAQSSSGQINHDYNAFFNDTNVTVSESNSQTSSVDPFADSTNGDFHLTAETKDGLHLSSPYDVDPDGVKRGSDNSIWTRGAYQYAPNSSSPDPPSNLVLSVH
ncbi:MAG: hypothetical protein P8Z30_08165, partial [Acidobacteriota bacterium]